MLQLREVSKSYKTDTFTQVALDAVSVSFRDNEFVAVLGPSGSGKTTMLNILGGLDRADSGDIVINGVSTKDYKSKDWDTYRNHRVGFIFQSYNLIPHQSVLSNVELALTLSGVGRAERKRRALAALEEVGLKDHVHKRPNQLSGGQMQRVAIARALVNDPDIVLADEPTGALDTQTGIQVMDILKRVAEDRLVVMVTHNPELAEQYATRIVRLRDGSIEGDTNPLTPAEQAQADMQLGGLPRKWRESKAKGKKHASMGFLTALSLSANNLWSKKGRTILTAFAGSIGIIGIAAILALSDGVNNYIAKTEEGALSSCPLQITRSSADFAGMMNAASADEGTGETEGSDGGQGWADTTAAAADPSAVQGTDLIPESTMVADMFAQVKSNDLSSFKTFLESGQSDVDDHVSTITYRYGITPQIYATDTSQGVTKLGSPFASDKTSMQMAGASMGFSGSGSSSGFSEMLDDQELLDSQYDVVAGSWPHAADEAVLVLGDNGTVSDYTLYCLGVLDPQELKDIVDSVSETDKKVEVPDTKANLSYDDALGLTFKVVDASSLYQRNASTGTWTDMSDDEAYMRQAVDKGMTLRVVGVVRPNASTQTASLSEGIAYTHALTQKLMDEASTSAIVQEQLANPDVDVFTGKTFEELQSGVSAFDMNSIFSVDEQGLKNAFKFDTSKRQRAMAGSGSDFDLSGVDFSSAMKGIDGDAAQKLIAQKAPEILNQVFDEKTSQELSDKVMAKVTTKLDDDKSFDKTEVNAASGAYSKAFFAWAMKKDSGVDLTDVGASDFDRFRKTPEGKKAAEQLDANTQVSQKQLQEIVQTAMKESLDEMNIDARLSAASGQLTKEVSDEMAKQIQEAMRRAGAQLGNAVQAQMAGQMGKLSSALQSSFSVDASAFQNSIRFNLTQDDLTSILTSYANASQLTYDNNLKKLGYANASDPSEIDLYPKSFDDKEAVLDIIDDYNQQMKDAGQDDKTIGYTDMVGTLLTSVTDIVNTISMVLIAFVSISLVVSSIMIAIITYISVLERKKEIGILRAMGASKLNVANIFNAETIIEGLVSGVFAILAVLIVEAPVNAYVYDWRHVADIMALSPENALVLIAISVALTLVAGIIPSSIAARRDPVEALRSE